MGRFVHVLLTRFNVSFLGRPLPDRAWLAHRFELFEHFCFPSVVAQSCQDFKWLLFFDPHLDEDSRARIETYRRFKNFEPVYIDEAVNAPILSRSVESRLHGFDYLITSRLDNDDALATRYVETIQSCFDNQAFQFLNF